MVDGTGDIQPHGGLAGLCVDGGTGDKGGRDGRRIEGPDLDQERSRTVESAVPEEVEEDRKSVV